MKVMIAAGGSGGHIFPAIALAKSLKKKNSKINILFIGSKKELDRRIFEKERFGFSLLSSNKLPYGFCWQFIPFAFGLTLDIIRAIYRMIIFKPDVVVGFGGYVSFPVVIAAFLFGIPKIVHEQNVVPGRANRILFKLADRIALSFKETEDLIGGIRGKYIFTGNPIRPEMAAGVERGGRTKLGLDESKFTILVIGGSQGSHNLNDSFIKALTGLGKEAKKSLAVIHITGIKDYEWAAKEYEGLGFEHRVYSFIDRIEEAYGAADLVITRSGASAIFELAAFAKPMILVPYPYAMSHQVENAKVFAAKDAAIEIDECASLPDIFKDNISNLFRDRDRLKMLSDSAKKMSIPDASDRLGDAVLKLARYDIK